MMTTLLTILWAILLTGFMLFVYLKTKANAERIEQNLNYIKQNKELIEQNSQLIHLINIMLSTSSLKVDWKSYKAKLKAAGVHVPEDNLDIEDPEG